MVQSTPPFRATSVEDSNSELDNLPALLKELDDAAGVAHGVETKLDALIAQIEALEKSLELEGSSHDLNVHDSDNAGEEQRKMDQVNTDRVENVEGGIEPHWPIGLSPDPI